jgi:hypothetical protein
VSKNRKCKKEISKPVNSEKVKIDDRHKIKPCYLRILNNVSLKSTETFKIIPKRSNDDNIAIRTKFNFNV